MLTPLIVRIVDLSRRFYALVILLALAASIGLGLYAIDNFKINTDINQLLAKNLDWRVREIELEKAFPQKIDQLVVVIDSASPDAAEDAAMRLAEKMQTQPDLFKNVKRPDNIPFFRKNGLLYLSTDELSGILETLIKAQPLLGILASDPSLRGIFSTFALIKQGLEQGEVDFKQLDAPLTKLAETAEAALSGQTKLFPLRGMMAQGEPKLRDLRKFILTQPVLDYSALSPGEKASDVLRSYAKELGPDVTVRLTGSVALNDEEFASVAEGAEKATILSAVLVLFLLFLALRSFRLIAPILLTLTAGLITTTAFAMAAIGSLNLISVAFAVMFVGIAVDFGIQFGVRYRDEHHKEPDNAKALMATAHLVAFPLILAASFTVLGFLAFTPTDYRGVAELGLIAGVGMIIAFFLNLTLLPALLVFFRPSAEPEAIGYAWAAPIDTFIEKHHKGILHAASIAALVGLVIASTLRFDPDPLNLKDPNTESVSTILQVMKEDPNAVPAIEILEPSEKDAEALALKIAALPKDIVRETRTLASFVPEDQDKKRAMIEDANMLLAPTINPLSTAPKPSDEETFNALKKAAEVLNSIEKAPPSAQRLAKALDEIAARHDPTVLKYLHDALIRGMEAQLSSVRDMLSPQTVTLDSISNDLRRDWITPDGRALIEVYPAGDTRDSKVLSNFTETVRQVAPNASGSPISIQESGHTITNAFIKAGVAGVFAIALLAFFILRHVADVARLIAPLILAGILTLATMVIVHLPLNFANIIALPLLLSLGVSYAIYFVTYWQNGMTRPLQSSMARAVLFSAATTLVAFGTLSLSSHPGTSSMGKLLTLALLYSLLCTFLVLPALLARARSR